MGAEVQNTGGKRQPKKGDNDKGGFGLLPGKRTIGYVQDVPKPSGSQRNNKDD